ncbi:Voltage-dependent calcium channel subunit alpha-2/delta-1 [Liparis tanakae]|uniref:Voltage-dependent calcium channel subunit alpha-2/delta-1 n=1 Tax=Liparis tanakae TaxID=230148 RepID=A0A4Z2J887_9TELE|nr:Voltage-dependent calcium channel subunit alpha-2/delta-1 [Liparis tanakae]
MLMGLGYCKKKIGCLSAELGEVVEELRIKEWVEQMQKELVTLADSATAGKSLTQIFLRNQHLYTVEQNDAEELVARAARKIEQLLRKRSAALEIPSDV